MDKTLYLSEKRGLQVRRDGPSVWVTETGKAGRRVPVRLVSRVVIIGNLRVESAIVTLFTEHNVPVTFMNRRGEELAVAIPFNHQLPHHYEEQKALLDDEENVERFRQWTCRERRRLQLETIERLSSAAAPIYKSKGFRDRDYDEFIHRYAMMAGTIPERKLAEGIITGLFREMVVGELLKADLDPHLGVVHRRHNFGLALDICSILEPEIHLQAIQFLRAAKGRSFMLQGPGHDVLSKDGMKDLIHRFENKRVAQQACIGAILDGLFELIREVRL
jgi:CRISPR/Cas system-associated endonuclease Cas1